MATPERKMAMLIEALRLLAADYHTQKSLFPDYVLVPEEIALVFHDCVLLGDHLVSSGLLTNHQLESVAAIDRELELRSNQEQKDFWTEQALRSSETWEKIRRRAQEALGLLGSRMALPRLDWLTFVPGDQQ